MKIILANHKLNPHGFFLLYFFRPMPEGSTRRFFLSQLIPDLGPFGSMTSHRTRNLFLLSIPFHKAMLTQVIPPSRHHQRFAEHINNHPSLCLPSPKKFQHQNVTHITHIDILSKHANFRQDPDWYVTRFLRMTGLIETR